MPRQSSQHPIHLPPPHPHRSPVLEIQSNYSHALRDLTFNSKPIINHLTMMAGEYYKYSHAIVQVIKDHMSHANPKILLSILFLIDSICKNIREPYVSTFEDLIVPIFLSGYYAVEPVSARNEFLRVLDTWEKAELFHISTINHLKCNINKQYKRPDPYHSTNLDEQKRSKISHPSNVHDISSSGPSFEYSNQHYPDYYDFNHPHFVPPQQMPQNFPSHYPPTVPSVSSFYPPPASFQSSHPHYPASSDISTLPFTVANAQSANYMNSFPTFPVTEISSHGMGAYPLEAPIIESFVVSTKFAPTSSVESLINDPNELLNIILSSGVEQSSTSATSNNNKLPFIPLNSDSVKKRYNGVVEALYENMTLQCKTCGLRFADDDVGRKIISEHMDWHFRRNRRQKERLKKLVSRGWYLTVSQWLQFDKQEFTDQATSSFFDEAHNEDTTPEENITVYQQVSLPFTIVQENEEGRICDSCNEKFVVYWNEDVEDWVFRNSIRIDDKIYHTTCHSVPMTPESS